MLRARICYQRFGSVLLAGIITTVAIASGAAQLAQPDLIADFSDGWSERWTHVRLRAGDTRYSVVDEGENPVLRAESSGSASAIWRPVKRQPAVGATVAWRWKVERALEANSREREKAGDDYAARAFVVFGDAEPFTRDSRALCYVWASGEPVGSIFENPYYSTVITIVLESGDERAGSWVMESRNFFEDYRAAFGEPPGEVAAIAVMVDTDNTKSTATAWFDDIAVTLDPDVRGTGDVHR